MAARLVLLSLAALAAAAAAAEYYLSDVPFSIEQSGYGPLARDRSTGEDAADDGVGMSIGGRAFAKGVGVHSTSVIGVALLGGCSEFRAFVGVDDETHGEKAIPGGPYGSVTFEVFVDGKSRFKSEVLRGGDAAVEIAGVDLTGALELLLVVGDGGENGFTKDHADWADAVLVCAAKVTGDVSKLKKLRGEWGETLQWPVKAIHSSLLPGNGGSGIIVSHASLAIGTIGDNNPDFPHDRTKVDTANIPTPSNTGTWDHAWVDREGVEMYCSGHVVHNGGVLEFGGHGGQINFVYFGKTQTSRYDPGKGWTVLQDMAQARWYPTALTLGNGEILSIGGSHQSGNNYRPEVYNPKTNTWRTLSGVDYQGLLVTKDKKIILDDTYPFTVLASDGRVLWAGWDTSMSFIDTTGEGAWEQRGQREGFRRAWASPLLIRVDELLLVGGLDPALNDGKAVSSVVKMSFPGGATPVVSYVAPMIFPRVDAQATILPDGTAFVNGGANEHRLGSSPTRIFAGEIYNPATGTWSVTSAAKNQRGYHSTALLLPDGRVWTAGGECSAEANGADNCPSGKTAEIFSPPYLFNADGGLAARPAIGAVDEVGTRPTMAMTSGSDVARVTLVRTGSSTHHMNFDQRFVELEFAKGNGDGYTLTIPESTNVLPPGHYLLSVIDSAGVPSVSKFVLF
jgi:galactose oxidase